MKSKQFFLIDELRKDNCLKFINELQPGKIKVTISDSGTKSQRQQNLDWKWDDDIYKSGIGWHDKTVEDVHARNKWMFALPILLRDTNNDLFICMYEHFTAMYGKDKKKCLEFSMDYISTQSMSVSDVSEYMENKQRFWIEKGVNLTNPDLYGLEI